MHSELYKVKEGNLFKFNSRRLNDREIQVQLLGQKLNLRGYSIPRGVQLGTYMDSRWNQRGLIPQQNCIYGRTFIFEQWNKYIFLACITSSLVPLPNSYQSHVVNTMRQISTEFF